MKKISTVIWGIVLIAAGALFALNALNNVHQPSKKMSMFVMFNAFSANNAPAAISTIPQITVLIFFITTSFFLFINKLISYSY